jgi:hypothetical protein
MIRDSYTGLLEQIMDDELYLCKRVQHPLNILNDMVYLDFLFYVNKLYKEDVEKMKKEEKLNVR